MRNYDAIMQTMTPEKMAEMNVKLVTVNNTNLFYMTSSGQLFNTNQYNDAVVYEYNWLTNDPEAKDTESCDRCQVDTCEEIACGQPTCECEDTVQSSTDEVAN